MSKITKVDTIRTICRELFTVRFLYDGNDSLHPNFISNSRDPEPDKETKKLLGNYDITCRFINDTLICFARCNNTLPEFPFKKFPGDFQIRFIINASSDFINRTFTVFTGSKKAYQFSNEIDNVDGTDKLITEPVEKFSILNDFLAGTIVESSGRFYATLKPVKAVEKIAITNTEYWKQINSADYVVNNADLKDISELDVEEPCFAVLDIYNNETISPDYKLLEGVDQKFTSPVYTIKFKSKIQKPSLF